MRTANYTSDASPLSIDVTKRHLIVAVIIAQLLSFVPLSAVSVYVVRAMCTTSILHLNLRLLFVWHAVAVLLFVAGKAYGGVMNLLLLHTPLFPFTGSLVDGFLSRFGGLANVYVTPILVVERIMATRAVDTYEQKRRGHYVLYTLMLLALLMSAFSAIKDIYSRVYGHKDADTAAVLLNAFYIVGSIMAYVVLLLVLRHNERFYRAELRQRKGHSLSERYQRSENIRASRQLVPVIFFHVLLIIPAGLFYYLVHTGALRVRDDFAVVSNLLSLLTSWMYLALQATIITSHPTLRREAASKLRRFGRSLGWSGENQVTPVTYKGGCTIAIVDQQPGALASMATAHQRLKTLDGKELIPQLEDQQAEHFKNLAFYWETYDPKFGETLPQPQHIIQ